MGTTVWLRMGAVALAASLLCMQQAGAQTTPKNNLPELIQQAQTVSIPLIAIDRQKLLPVEDLTASAFSFDVDGKPHPFQLARPWSATVNPKTGQAEDRPNLLIILPLAGPLDRSDALKQTIDDLTRKPELGWNISILDDSGNQTPYTRDIKSVLSDLESIAAENPQPGNLEDWRRTAALAIAEMRDLPGRRVVISLGDIFHEVVIEQGELVYENFGVEDIASAARNAGAIIYAAESFPEIDLLRRLAPYYFVTGSGPWLLIGRDGHIAGWISDSVASTLQQIRRDGMGAYDIALHLTPGQMDGQPHVVSVTPHQPAMLLDAPAYYIAPDLAGLRLLAGFSPALRNTLQHPPAAESSPLQLATQLAYFPHPDRKSGTQIATTGFFWTGTTPHPAQMETALQVQEAGTGFIADISTVVLRWSVPDPVWNSALSVAPGAYTVRVAAADPTGKITAATDTPFTVEPSGDEPVLISSLVLGKSCVFAPPPAAPATVDYLLAGNCDLQPDPSHYFSPQNIVWTLVRITPTGKLAGRPSKDWKSSFLLVDAKGSKRAEEKVHWITGTDGSLIATAAFPLENPKLKLENGEYAIVFRLKGPGIEDNYQQDSPFMVYGVPQSDSEAKK